MLEVCAQEVYQKKGETYPCTNKPLLLFVAYGYDNNFKMNFVRINGIKNPLPFKIAYGINGVFLKSWLKSMGWEEVGYSLICDD